MRARTGSLRARGAVAAAAAVLLLLLSSPLVLALPLPAAGAGATSAATTATATSATVAVDGSSNAGALHTQLSNQLVWAGMLDPAPGGVAHFDAVEGGGGNNIVRIHAGDDGTVPSTAPEQKVGSWSFAPLDQLVSDVDTAGATVLLNIKFAPDWQWTCAAPYDTGETGQVRDQTYGQFAQYMARIVSYYNTGQMTTESGTVIANPAGTSHRIHYWEIWNEPDGSWETPCVPPASLDPGGEALTPAQYDTMWNAVVPAMLAVDPTIALVGPTLANANTGHSPDYVADLIAHATHEPDVISYHAYGGWAASQTDQEMLTGSSNTDGLDGGAGADYAYIVAQDTIGAPIWVTEANVNADGGGTPRATNAYGVAYGASEFAHFARDGVSVVQGYDFVDSPGFGLIADTTYSGGWVAGSTYLVYWRDLLIHQQFPSDGSAMLLATTSSRSPGVDALAVRRSDGSVVVLLSNRQPNSSTVVNGSGLSATVTVNLANYALGGGTPASVTLTQIDATTSASAGPATQSEPASSTQRVTFASGYGMAVLVFSGTGGTGSPTPSPTATATVTATPTNTPTPSPTPTPTFADAPAVTAAVAFSGGAGSNVVLRFVVTDPSGHVVATASKSESPMPSGEVILSQTFAASGEPAGTQLSVEAIVTAASGGAVLFDDAHAEVVTVP